MSIRAGDIKAGEIYHLTCVTFNPPQQKFHVFLGDGYFFLINTSYYYESIEINESNYSSFLTHDSHICYSNLFKYDENKQIDTKNYRGILTKMDVEKLIKYIPDSDTLTPVHQQLILELLKIFK